MMILDCGGEDYLKHMPTDNEIFRNLSEFYKIHGTLPLNEEKNIITVFRLAISVDNNVEELLKVKQREAIKTVSNNENMDMDMVDD